MTDRRNLGVFCIRATLRMPHGLQGVHSRYTTTTFLILIHAHRSAAECFPESIGAQSNLNNRNDLHRKKVVPAVEMFWL